MGFQNSFYLRMNGFHFIVLLQAKNDRNMLFSISHSGGFLEILFIFAVEFCSKNLSREIFERRIRIA